MANTLSPIRAGFGVLAAGLVMAGCAGVNPGPPAPSSAAPSSAAPSSAAPTPPARSAGRLSINTPIAVIAADPGGRAVLEHDLPGLLERPEYGMFKSLSLKALAPLSNGKITAAMLANVQRDLAGVRPASSANR